MVAVGGGAESVTVEETAEVSPAALNFKVSAPVPLIDRLLKEAEPFAFVVTVAVPFKVPAPLPIAAVTAMPD